MNKIQFGITAAISLVTGVLAFIKISFSEDTEDSIMAPMDLDDEEIQ